MSQIQRLCCHRNLTLSNFPASPFSRGIGNAGSSSGTPGPKGNMVLHGPRHWARTVMNCWRQNILFRSGYFEKTCPDGYWAGEVRHTTKDGKELIIDSRQQIIARDGRKIVIESNRDISERRGRKPDRDPDNHRRSYPNNKRSR